MPDEALMAETTRDGCSMYISITLWTNMQLVDDYMTEKWERIRVQIEGIYPELGDRAVNYAVNKVSQLLRKAKCDIYNLSFSSSPFEYDGRDLNETIEVSGKLIYLNAKTD